MTIRTFRTDTFLISHLSIAVAALAALPSCTLSNESSGGADGLNVETRQDVPSDRSIELFLTPGDNLLATLVEVEAEDRDVLATGNLVVGSVLSEVGSYYSAAINFQPGGTPYVTESMQCEGSILPDAIDVICANLAGGEIQLVFIDETPHFAQHRVAGRRLLECAREAGFEYLVLEALDESAESLARRGYVSRTASGPYVREPQFAGLIEDGLRLGYTPISLPAGEFCTDCTPVEAFSQNAEPKADSLIAQTLDIDPAAKVLVWTGPGQAYEQPWGPRPFVNSLASYVFSKSGIDPYTLTQITLEPTASLGPTPASGMYLASGPENGSCSGSYSPGSATGLSTHDGVIVHVPPRGGAQGSDADRWDWLHAVPENRMSVTPECAACTAGQRLLIQAFPTNVDLADRVPADQALCQSGVACQLALPPGEYQLIVWSDTAQLTSAQVTLASDSPATVTMN
jgi:hypothetical protein